MALHVVHRAVIVPIEPLREAGFSLAKIEIADTDVLETKLETPTPDIRHQPQRFILSLQSFRRQCLIPAR
jgi:hypothetical protein